MTTRHTPEFRKLSRRPASVWRAALSEIPNPGVRCKVAVLVWWDFFSDKRGSPSPMFHYFLDKVIGGKSDGVLDADVRAALLALGYSAEKAERRSRTPNGDNDYARHREQRLAYTHKKRAKERRAKRLAKRK